MGPLYRRPCRAFTPCFLYENEEVENEFLNMRPCRAFTPCFLYENEEVGNEFLDMEVPQRSSSFHEW